MWNVKEKEIAVIIGAPGTTQTISEKNTEKAGN